MTVITPDKLEVHLTAKEIETITNCIQVLRNILTTLYKHDCDILEWENVGSQVTKESIDAIIYDLDILTNVDTMF